MKEMQRNLITTPNNSPEISRNTVDLQKGFKNRMTIEREELHPEANPQNHKPDL